MSRRATRHRISLSETHTLLRQPVNVGRFVQVGSIAAWIAPAQVGGENEYQIGRARAGESYMAKQHSPCRQANQPPTADHFHCVEPHICSLLIPFPGPVVSSVTATANGRYLRVMNGTFLG